MTGILRRKPSTRFRNWVLACSCFVVAAVQWGCLLQPHGQWKYFLWL